MVFCYFECFDIEEKEKEDSVDEKISNLKKIMIFVQKGIVDNIVLNIKEEQEFFFLFVVDLICNNKCLLGVLDCVCKDGFEDILIIFFDIWLNDIDIKEKRSFCIFVFVVFFG